MVDLYQTQGHFFFSEPLIPFVSLRIILLNTNAISITVGNLVHTKLVTLFSGKKEPLCCFYLIFKAMSKMKGNCTLT